MGDHFPSGGKAPEPQICIVILRPLLQAAATNIREMSNVITLIQISSTAAFNKKYLAIWEMRLVAQTTSC